ncbi:MAG TPA: DUF6789 family protein [Bradyrhizobium sp.]|nr:DUF6789 family protein [Bradyrhizobium sp.]
MNAAAVWRSIAAGFCGSLAHSGLMLLKSWMGWLPSFHPYEDLQEALSQLVGSSVHPAIPSALSLVNGALLLGTIFSYVYRLLQGRSGLGKGLVFGAFGWIAMGLFFFPLLGRGLFAAQVGLGPLPAIFSLLMILTYSMVMGAAYSVFYQVHTDGRPEASRSGSPE